MKQLGNFEEFVESGIVLKRRQDKFRAKSLAEESENRKKFLDELMNKIGITNENANYFIEGAYDVLISLIRAHMLSAGLYASGEGAHEAEISFMRNLGFAENTARFMNDLRYFRNGIKYYGKKFDSAYARKVMDFLESTYPELIKKPVV